jgi:hypothetical protein
VAACSTWKEGKMATTATPDLGIEGYDGLDVHRLVPQLRHRSQVELAEIDRYERSHQERKPVLDKLRYLRNEEPIAGYDGMTTGEVVAALSGADVKTLDAVRDYEMKLRIRGEVLAPVAELRREAARHPGAPEEEPAAVYPAAAGGGILGGFTTAGLMVFVVLAGVLMLALLAILTFVIIDVVAPDVLIN